MYLMTQTRPDLAFAAGRIARGMANPTTKDMEAAERLMGHIWRTRTEGITYRKQHPTSSSGIKLNAFVDAEFAGDHLDRRSTTGSCHRLDTCAIFAWRSGKQKLTSRSSTESELIALARRRPCHACHGHVARVQRAAEPSHASLVAWLFAPRRGGELLRRLGEMVVTPNCGFAGCRVPG